MAPKWLFKALLEVRSSLWFIPSLMVAGAILLNAGLTAVDAAYGEEVRRRWSFLAISGEGARSMFGAVAGAVITLAGVIYSITIVTLTMAANQYSSRVLRAFMGDRGNQVVLGYFAAVFTYSLMLLWSIRGGGAVAEFVPLLATLAGMLLAIGTVGFLIYFIDHVSESIQASHLVASLAQAAIARIDALFESRNPGAEVVAEDGGEAGELEGEWWPIMATETGYIQSIALDRLVDAARRHNTVVRMEFPVGGFVIQGRPLAWVSGEPSMEIVHALHDAVAVGHYRTLEQDPAFGIRQIVDVALKALSPGINDTTTAVTCVDHLTAVLVRLAGRGSAPCNHYSEGALCAVTKEFNFESALDMAFHEIRQHARDDMAVILRQLDSLERLGEGMPQPERRRLLWHHAWLIGEAAGRAVSSPHDRAVIDARLRRLAAALRRPAAVGL